MHNRSANFNMTYDFAGKYAYPSLAEYYGNLSPFITFSIFTSILLMTLNISIFFTTVAKLRKHLQPPFLCPSMLLCSIYTIVSAACVVTILAPKTWLVCHTVTHLSFTVGALIFRRLCILYVQSKQNLLKEIDGAELSINTPPCCCCCTCCPTVFPTSTKLTIFRCMVWQMPFVQGFVMIVLNILYLQDRQLYIDNWVHFIPIILSSILIGVWGLNITVRMVSRVHSEYRLVKKMFSLQLILLLGKLQFLILDSQLNKFNLGDAYPMNHVVYKQAFINLLLLAEMILVSLFAQSAYRLPVQIIDAL